MRYDRFQKFLVFAILALGFCLLGPALVHAAEGAAPETVAQAAGDTTKVTWAWGSVVSQWASALASMVIVGLGYLARQLPAHFAAVFANSRVQLLVENAVNYGINAVAGAVKDRTLTVDVGNRVLAEALQYAVDNAPGYLLAWAGGKDGLAKKILGKLDLDESSSAAALPAIVDSVQPVS